MVTGTRCQNEVASATYFLMEVAAATSHNHAYCACTRAPFCIYFTVRHVIHLIIWLLSSRGSIISNVKALLFGNVVVTRFRKPLDLITRISGNPPYW